MITENNYRIYMHICPNGKKYIGITKGRDYSRYGKNGIGYMCQKKFFNAILYFGWKNIIHEIIYENLSEEDARYLESKLIYENKTYMDEFGYNIKIGSGFSIKKEHEPIFKKIILLNTKEVFDSASKASMKYKVAISSVTGCCKNILKSGGKCDNEKLYWQYYDEYLVEPKLLSECYKQSNNIMCKKIICITTNEVFDSLSIASKTYSIDQASISKCCNGKRKSAGRHPKTGEPLVWEYKK